MAAVTELPPDELRCRRTDGRGWRCKRPALNDFTNCQIHLSKAQRRRFESGDPPSPTRRGRPPRPSSPRLPRTSLIELIRLPIPKKKRLPRVPVADKNTRARVLPDPTEPSIPAEETRSDAEETIPEAPNHEKPSSSGCSGELPEHRRCRRSDGKQWRCRRPAMDDHYFCELHRIQAYRRQNKLAVPDSLKLRRGWPPGVKRAEMKVKKRRREEEEDDGVEEKKRRKRSEKPLAELVRMVLRKRKVKEKKKLAKVGLKVEPKVVLNSRIDDEAGNVPDHLRCRRTDGKRWRCSRRAMDNLSFCEIHHIQAYRRQYRLGVPESLKLKRRPRGAKLHQRRARGMRVNWMIGKLGRDADEVELRRAAKMEKVRKENEALLVQVMGMVLQRQMEKRERERKRREEEVGLEPEVVRKVLPNGVMSIVPVISGNASHVNEQFDKQIRLDSSPFLRWCFRSKNVDLSPAASLQMLPCARTAVGLGKRRRQVCHHCHTSQTGKVLKCRNCRKAFFCRRCIKKWYPELSISDVRMSCPICRGKCCCALCTCSKPKDHST